MLIREVFVAGVPKAFNHPGNYFRIKRVTGLVPESLDCTFFRNGAVVDVDVTKADPGDFAYLPAGFDRVEVVSTIAQTVTVQIARGRVGSDRVMGDVSVIDLSAQRSKQGLAFGFGAAFLSAAGNMPALQLWNLPASGKNLILDDIVATLNGGAVSYVFVTIEAIAQTTLAGQPNAKNLAYVASAAAQVRSGQAAVVAGVTIALFRLGADLPFVVPLKSPVVLVPGSGLSVWRSLALSEIDVAFGHYEEPI